MSELERIGIIGAGVMTRALAPALRAAGYDVVVGGRDTRRTEDVAAEAGVRAGSLIDAAEHGDVIVLAVRWEGVEWTLAQVGDRLRGKVLVDVTNPVEVEGYTLVTPPGTSLAEQVQERTGARVVKAFNLAQASVWSAPRAVAGRPLAVPIAGDDDAARRTVGALAAALGHVALDAGELHHARHLEAMAAVVIRRLWGGDPATTTFAWTDVGTPSSARAMDAPRTHAA